MEYRIWDIINKKYIAKTQEVYTKTFVDENGIVVTSRLTFDEDDGDAPYIDYSDYNQENYIVEQSTGQLDKNGKEIYEGDVIDIHETVNGFNEFLIVFEKLRFNARYNQNETKDIYNYDFYELIDYGANIEDKTVEVIGTIHDKEI